MLCYYDILLDGLFSEEIDFASVNSTLDKPMRLFDTHIISQHLARRVEIGAIIKHVIGLF